MTKEGVEEGVFQLIPVEEYSPKKGEVALWESMVDVAGIVPIMLATQANKTMKLKKGRIGRKNYH